MNKKLRAGMIGAGKMGLAHGTIINSLPNATIVSISPDPAYRNNATYTTVTFNGSANDIDGEVTAYSWSSNLDGQIGNTINFTLSVDSLVTGNHTITFKAKDDYGDWSLEYSSSLMVLENPNASIDSVSSTFINQYSSVSLVGSSSDEDGEVTDYNWVSSIDGLIGTMESISV